MSQAFAPRMPGGFSWIMLAILAVASAGARPASGQATAPDPGKAAPKPADPKPRGDDAKPDADDDGDDKGNKGEVFLDPNAKKYLTKFDPIPFVGPQIKVGNPPDDRSKMQNIAAGNENIDLGFIKRYIEFFASELTKRENLNALLSPPPGMKPDAPQARALERAVAALTQPIIDSKALDKTEFLNAYTRALFDSTLPKLLENNYLTRIDAMIVLGMAGSTATNALDLYNAQLRKADQVIWVKLWAARGLSNAAQDGRVNLEASKANQSADAVLAFLDSDPKLPWPAQLRAMEALGSIRLASVNTPKGRVDSASVVLRYLADPAARPEVRARAAWALGMMRTAPVNSYNFALAGHEVGELVVLLGRKVVEEYDDNPAGFDRDKDQAAYYAGLLLFQAIPALSGVDAVSDSGLLRAPNLAASGAKPYLTKLDENVKAVAREAYELLRAGGTNQKARRDELDAKVAALQGFLNQSPPKDRHLVPGGPEFPVSVPRVAGAPRP